MQFPLTLTQNNARKLVNGHPIQLKAEQLHGKDHYLMLHPSQHARLSKARGLNKGARLKLTDAELAASGEGFKDLWAGIKKGAQWIKSNIIDQPLYQKYVRPIAKEAVQAAETAVTPLIPAPLAPLVQQAIQKGSEVTGAYGLAMTQPKKVRVVKGLSQSANPKPKAKRARKAVAKPSGSFLVN